MKRCVVAAVTLVAAVGLGACGHTADPDDAYLSVTRTALPALSDSQRLSVRTVVCDHLRNNPTRQGWLGELKPMMSTLSINAYAAGQVLGASTSTGCPEMVDLAPAA